MPRSQGRRRHYSRTWSWFGSTYPERWNGLAIELAEWTRLSSLESCEFGGRVEVKGPFARMGCDEGGSAEREQPTQDGAFLAPRPAWTNSAKRGSVRRHFHNRLGATHWSCSAVAAVSNDTEPSGDERRPLSPRVLPTGGRDALACLQSQSGCRVEASDSRGNASRASADVRQCATPTSGRGQRQAGVAILHCMRECSDDQLCSARSPVSASTPKVCVG
jgi:hypothetical protein